LKLNSFQENQMSKQMKQNQLFFKVLT
jgi:hypothetical protein